jgi:CubicO group peptidase (beta-lactamase class C family)
MAYVVKLMSWVLLLSATTLLHAQATDSPAGYIAAIENPQLPDRGGFDAMTLEQVMRKLRVPGISIAVIKDFTVHWVKGYGVADVDTGAKVDTDTLFQAASISKPLTAMALMKAAQDGKFSIDDDINSILRSWKLAGADFNKVQPVTPRALASHTSGLGDGFGFPGYAPGAPLPTIVQILGGQPPSNVGVVALERPPLQAIKYSGGGFVVLQLALTDSLKQPFAEIMRGSVLDPIGMTRSTFEQPLSPERDRNAARAHDGRGLSMGDKWHVYPELAAAGLWTTPTDLAKFAIEIQKSLQGQSNRVLSKASVRDMLSPVGVGEYGVGLALEKRGQGWYFQHGGSNWGFLCQLQAHKLKGYGLVVMTNASSGQLISEIRSRVERAYGWDSLDRELAR